MLIAMSYAEINLNFDVYAVFYYFLSFKINRIFIKHLTMTLFQYSSSQTMLVTHSLAHWLSTHVLALKLWLL